MNAKPRLVVCGVSGFIGRNIAQTYVAEGCYEVVGVCRNAPADELPGVLVKTLDLTDPIQAAEALAGADIVIQAAATTSGAGDIATRPYIHVADNAVMNSHILRVAFDLKVKHLVFFSCTVMYPSSPEPVAESGFDANAEIEPKYFGAAWTKVYIEKMCEFYSRIGETRFTVVRHSNIYGPHDKFDLERSHVFGATVAKVMAAEGGKITVWGRGTEGRDLLYVSDLVDFVKLAVARQREKFALYNVGLGSIVSVGDLVKAIIGASGKPLEIEYDLSKPTIATSLCLDCSRAERELGWKPKVALAEGIKRTLAWYREHVCA